MSTNNAEAQASDEELVTAWQSGEMLLSELPQRLQKAILEPQAPQQEETPSQPEPIEELIPVQEEPQPEKDGEPKEAETPEAEVTEESEKKPKKRKKRTMAELQEIALKRADKLNEVRQATATHEHKFRTDANYRAEYNRKMGVSIEAPRPKADVWDDDFQAKQAAEVERLRRIVEQGEQSKQLQNTYRNLEGFAQRQGYKFNAPISEIDEMTKGMTVKLGRTPTETELADAGFDASDVDVYNQLVETQRLQKQNNYPTFESAWYDNQRLTGRKDLPKADGTEFDDFEATDRAARTEKMRQVLNQPKMVRSQRAKEADTGLTTDYAIQWLRKNPDSEVYTAEQQQTYGRVMKMLGH